MQLHSLSFFTFISMADLRSKLLSQLIQDQIGVFHNHKSQETLYPQTVLPKVAKCDPEKRVSDYNGNHE